MRRSKTDQEGECLTKMIAYGSEPATCPVRAVQDWLALSDISEGPVFRSVSRHERLGEKPLSDFAVAVIIKRARQKSWPASAAALRALAARGPCHRA